MHCRQLKPLSRLGRAVRWAAALSIALSSCVPFQQAPDLFVNNVDQLPTIRAARDTIRLDILFVERPVDDPLAGSRLWQEVDQVSGLSPEIRDSLDSNGFRIGQVGSTPPQVLQRMLGLTTETAEMSDQHNSRCLSGRKIHVPSGGETVIQANDLPYPACDLVIQKDDGPRTEHMEHVRCVFRVTVQRLQDGWAKLEFLPEIHHDARTLRPVATETAWEGTTSQKIEPLYGQQFHVTLNVGEMVVIAADGHDSQSVAHQFFYGPDAKCQKLLVLRLADMKKVDPVYAD